MNGMIIGALMALSMVQQTDTTFAVDGAEYLDVETLGGSITVGVWDEDRIRIRAEHSTRTFVEIDRNRRGISVESEARRGPANIVDFVITVPRRLSLQLEAQYGDITIDGADGAVEAETMRGDVTIRGGRGTIEVSSTMGNIYVDGADGTIEIESSAADIRVENSSGEIYAETAGGTIVLENVDPMAVDVGSTGGRVHYSGTFRRGGTYFFGAHGGSITIVVPEDASASFNVATVHGSITSTLKGQPESFQGGERHTFTVGDGGALVEAETYGGRIRLVRPGTEGAQAPERRIRDGQARDASATELAFGWGGAHALAGAGAGAGGGRAYAYDYQYEYDYDYEYDYEYDYDYEYEYHYDGECELEHEHEIDVEPVIRDERPVPVRVPQVRLEADDPTDVPARRASSGA